MGKTYIDTVKYTIHAKFGVEGLVEKPDVVGAIFGQTEGLLGEELDLRDLQKNGRIGRIEVNTTSGNIRTTGLIKIPSSLDRIETAVIAAAMETVDRVGPCDAKFEIEKIEDNRDAKRKRIVEKAKDLFKAMLNDQIPDSKEIIELVRADVKIDDAQTYGPDRLVSGKGVEKSESVILVEGRADVLNMLRNDIDNVVAIGGAKITPTVIELTKKKEVTVFLDGDRGGDIILNELVNAGAEIDFVSRAPPGTEVEELTRKELIKAVRSAMPFEQYSAREKESQSSGSRRQDDQRSRFGGGYSRQRYGEYPRDRPFQQRSQPTTFAGVDQPNSGPITLAPAHIPDQQAAEPERKAEEPAARETGQDAVPWQQERAAMQERVKDSALKAMVPDVAQWQQEKMGAAESRPFGSKEPAKAESVALPSAPREKVEMTQKSLVAQLGAITGQSKARLYNSAGEVMNEVYVRDMIRALDESHEPLAIVFDGIITQRLVDISAQKGAKWLVGQRAGNVKRVPDALTMVTSQ
jgi:DNA primase